MWQGHSLLNQMDDVWIHGRGGLCGRRHHMQNWTGEMVITNLTSVVRKVGGLTFDHHFDHNHLSIFVKVTSELLDFNEL